MWSSALSDPDSLLGSVLREHSPITEAFVEFLWREQCFVQDQLRTLDGRPLRVLKPGRLNRDAGPDFSDAEIILDGELHTGPVELHLNLTDWHQHGHGSDPRYGDVILHVALWDDTHTLQTAAGSVRIPSLALAPFLSAPIDELLGWWREERSDLCPLAAARIDESHLLNTLDQLGQERLLEKVEHFSFEIARSNIEQVCYEGILEALGYAANREPFRELGRRIRFEKVIDRPLVVTEALLFGTAGLLPSQSGGTISEEGGTYVKRLEEIWYGYPDAPTPMRTTDWKFARLRPANFPTRRLAGMAAILATCNESSLLLRFLSAIEQRETTRGRLTVLRAALMPRSGGFWIHHSRFGGKSHRATRSLIGSSRASDIIVNILLPILALWSTSVQSEALSQTLGQLYDSHPRLQPNRITRQVVDWLRVPACSQKAKVQQGMIYLYRLFCGTGLCGVCPIAQTVVKESPTLPNRVPLDPK